MSVTPGQGPRLRAAKKQKIRIGGEWWAAAVLHVVERDPDGSPRLLRLVRQDEHVDISGGNEEFIIVYAPERCMTRRS